MLYLKWPLSITLLILSLFSTNSYAEQNYQTELIGGYEKTDRDSSTTKLTMLLADIFLSPVNTENKPLAEAAFLDKSSSIGLGYIKQKTDLQNSSVNSFDVNGTVILINYITEADAYILGIIFSNSDIDADNNQFTGDNKTTGFNIGKYLDDSSTIEFSYINSDTETRTIITNQTFNSNIDQYNISYTIVQALDATHYYRFEAGIELIKGDFDSVKEDNLELGIQGQYYFTHMTGIGAEATFNSGDDISQEGKTLVVNASHFFTPQFALEIDLEKFIADDSQTEDRDSISVEAIARF